MYLLLVHCLSERFVNMYLFVNNHWCCCLELIVHTNAGITVKCLLISDMWYFTFLQSLFFLWWNYMCLGIEPLLIYRFLQQLTRSRTVYCITRCEKIIEHIVTSVNIIYYIVTIWVHFKRNNNLFDQVLINVITVVLFSLYLNQS